MGCAVHRAFPQLAKRITHLFEPQPQALPVWLGAP
jgi:hypothetical protein